jgi:hypothetical protein
MGVPIGLWENSPIGGTGSNFKDYEARNEHDFIIELAEQFTPAPNFSRYSYSSFEYVRTTSDSHQ